MLLRSIVLIVMLIAGISESLRADEGVVSKRGDRFSVFQSTDRSGGALYELRRTSPQGEVTTLWRNAPRTASSTQPQPAPLVLSSITAICEEGNEISLLLRESEADALVFRFASTATTATPVRISNLLRPGDPSHGLRFKHHGEILFERPVNSIEKLVRFGANGEIVSDFRPLTKRIFFSSAKDAEPPQADRKPASPNLDQGSEPSGNRSPVANPQPERNPESPLAAAVEPPLGSTSWLLWGGIMLGTLILAYLFFKRREP